ncbi:hypothetical protein BDV10DRAFT_161570 [Aspergillus recurvatus]
MRPRTRAARQPPHRSDRILAWQTQRPPDAPGQHDRTPDSARTEPTNLKRNGLGIETKPKRKRARRADDPGQAQYVRTGTGKIPPRTISPPPLLRYLTTVMRVINAASPFAGLVSPGATPRKSAHSRRAGLQGATTPSYFERFRLAAKTGWT